MKTYSKHLFSILLLFIAVSATATTLFNFPVTIEEKVVLFTDRSIFIAGEQIQFSASVFTNNVTDEAVQSRILYCELVTPDGKVIANNKYLLSNSLAGGWILIPGDLLTGTYYVRAYTKLMRTNGPETYEYKQIRIINPHREEILTPENKSNSPIQQFLQVKDEDLNDLMSVSVDKTVYAPRDTINLTYELTNGSLVRIKSMCMSVVPESSKSLLCSKPASQGQLKAGSEYYPETRGISLVGKLTESTSQIPVVDKKVNLSIIGEGRDFMAARTDTGGRFFFALPDYYGTRDLFLCAEKTPSKIVKIWIDNDFCTTPFRLPSPVFSLNEQERQVVQNMAQNLQIRKRFTNDNVADSLNPIIKTNAFYGKPTTTIILDKYISLPTLEEYFNELPSQVKVRKRKGEPYFAIQSSGTANLSFYDPLVLVDWVAVDEPAKILAASPQNISRIEVVNEDYIKGGQTYGGIISFISKKGDFAGIDLPSAGLFVNYHFLSENQCDENFTYGSTNIPDVRNTVLWKPAIKISSIENDKPGSTPSQSWNPTNPAQKYNVEKIVFTAPDTPGKYNIIFEGVTTNGDVFSVTSIFEVND
jgi:hypothetical protein